MLTRRACALLFVLSSGFCAAWAAPPPTYQYLRAGHRANRHVAPRGGVALMGGGTDLDVAFQWMCQRSDGGDFLVLRATGSDAYDSYIQKLCPDENSVATLIIPDRAAAQARFVAQAIHEAAAIFISGGDQSHYVNFWTGTPVQTELNAAIRRGVPIGGTSAGLAVLGEFAYSAQADKPGGPDLTSALALANPYSPQVVIARNFLRIPALAGVITDTHFRARDRLGRLLVFLARISTQDQLHPRGIGIDQHTALLLDPDRHGTVAGSGAVYFFSVSGPPAVCRPGLPLTFAPIAVRKLESGQSFNLHTWAGPGTAYTLSVATGVIHSSQPALTIY